MVAECISDGRFLIGFIPSTICLIINLIITDSSTNQFKSEEISIQPLVKVIYFLACFCPIISDILKIIYFFSCNYQLNMLYHVAVGFHFYANGFILLILLIRLYFTFKGSAYEISKFQKRSHITIWITNFFTSMIHLTTYDVNFNLYTIMLIISMFLYAVQYTSAMIVFASKMRKTVYGPDGRKVTIDEIREQHIMLSL